MGIRDFLMPDLGEGLEEAEIVGWRVAEGERVDLNQTLVEVNTAKALVEVPSPWAGVVERLHGSEGDVVKVGNPLVSIRVDESEPERPGRDAVLVGYGVVEEPPSPATSGPGGAPDEKAQREASADATGVRATPPVRRLARELGVDVAVVRGTGSEGRVTREDVQAAAHDVQVIPVRGTRRLIALQMARSVREIPHVTTFLTLDATEIQSLRKDLEATTGRNVSPLPIVVRALADICGQFANLNATFDAGRSQIRVFRRVHMGVATETDRGLLVPVVRDVRSKGIVEVADEIKGLTAAARAGTIPPEDLAGGTITVTNVGTFGAEFGTPIINFPQAAVLALGVIEPRALVVDGQVVARPAVTLSLAFDHRLLDGAEAGRALKALADLLESPGGIQSLPK